MQFKEGQSTNDASNPLQLPDDDPNATIDMFNLIHYKSELVKDDGLLELLFICDKYKCVQTFKEFWIWRMPKCKYSKAESLIVATITNDKTLFDASSEHVLRMNRSTFETNCRPMVLEAYGTMVDYMADYRTAIREVYHRIAYHFPAEACRLVGKASCSKLSHNTGQILTVLVSNGALPQSLDDDTIDLPDARDLLNCIRILVCNAYSCSVCSGSIDLKQKIRDMAKKIHVGRKGKCALCFECFKSKNIRMRKDCSRHILD